MSATSHLLTLSPLMLRGGGELDVPRPATPGFFLGCLGRIVEPCRSRRFQTSSTLRERGQLREEPPPIHGTSPARECGAVNRLISICLGGTVARVCEEIPVFLHDRSKLLNARSEIRRDVEVRICSEVLPHFPTSKPARSQRRFWRSPRRFWRTVRTIGGRSLNYRSGELPHLVLDRSSIDHDEPTPILPVPEFPGASRPKLFRFDQIAATLGVQLLPGFGTDHLAELTFRRFGRNGEVGDVCTGWWFCTRWVLGEDRTTDATTGSPPRDAASGGVPASRPLRSPVDPIRQLTSSGPAC